MEDKKVAPERLQRTSVTALDEMLGVPFRVLDEGFVRVIDYMGSDAAIVQAARVSYGAGTKHVQSDRNLIRYLLRNRHTTPFEMCEIKLHVRVPMDAWRQWIRHRTANVNEYSTRYSIAIDAAQTTIASEWRAQSATSRQGSSGYLDVSAGTPLSEEEKRFQEAARKLYQSRLDRGVAREQARKELPLSTYTEAYWKIDLHNLFHFLAVRMDQHAQQEIRTYANVIGYAILSKWCPLAWEAFLDYQLESMTFSSTELVILSLLTANRFSDAIARAEAAGWLQGGNPTRTNRERDEFEAKLQRLSIPAPWLTT